MRCDETSFDKLTEGRWISRAKARAGCGGGAFVRLAGPYKIT